MINKLCIIGLGLIGGSIAAALKKQKFVKHIIACDRDENNLKIAVKLQIIDDYSLDIKNSIIGCNVIIIATPVNSTNNILATIKPNIQPNMLITDVGSTKCSVIRDVQNILGNSFNKFIPAHPITGKEATGSINANADLFIGKKVIITPNNNIPEDIEFISKMWQKVGSIVEQMAAKKHDEIFALSSHLPHILAFSFVNYMAQHNDAKNWTGGGFKDFTRIASSDSTMWSDICNTNKEEILKHLNNYQNELTQLSKFIKDNEVKDYFANAKKHRDDWILGAIL